MERRRITFFRNAAVFLIQRPPVVKNLAVAVPLLRKARVSPHLFATHPFEPALTVAVLGVLDVFARVQERPSLKAPVYIAPVGCVAG